MGLVEGTRVGRRVRVEVDHRAQNRVSVPLIQSHPARTARRDARHRVVHLESVLAVARIQREAQ